MKKHSRRQFLRMGALTAVGAAAAACQPKTVIVKETVKETVIVEGTPKVVEKEVTKIVEKEVEKVVTATPKPVEVAPVTLEVQGTNPEYQNGEAQIWALYTDQNPHVTIEMFGVTEGASADAYNAKIASGWFPHIALNGGGNRSNYKERLNLLDTDFPWFDRWQYDVRTAWSQKFAIPDYLPCISWYSGFVITWQYHADLMEQAGLDPKNDVKTLDDMKEWLRAGTEWANANSDVDYFWDQAAECWWCVMWQMDMWGLSYPDGQREQQRKAWLGEIDITGPDSPYRYPLEFWVEAYNEGWVPKNWWAREWEADMENNFLAKRAAVMLHGPWTWDKAMATDPNIQQEGLPSTPPAAGQDRWMQYSVPPDVGGGFFMFAGVADLPEYPEVQKAFNWWLSPTAVKLHSELLGLPPLYDLDAPLEMEAPQWVGIVSEIGMPGGEYEDVTIDSSPSGQDVVGPYGVDDTQVWWNWQWANNVCEPLSLGEITVDDALVWIKEQIDVNYPSLPG